MKKIQHFIVFVIVFTVLLVACNKKDDKNQGTQMTRTIESVSTLAKWGEAIKKDLGGSKIIVSVGTHPATDAIKILVKDFTALTGIDVTWDEVDEESLKNKQLLDSQGNGSYDVLMVDSFYLEEYATKNIIVPLSPYVDDAIQTPPWYDIDDILPAYKDGITLVGGERYGIPLAGETRFIAYRTDLFEKYNKQPPNTMDEFLELARFFNGKEPGLYGIAMRAQRGIHFASGWMTIMYNFSKGYVDQSTIGTDSVKVTIDTPETRQSLQFFIDLLKNAPKDVGSFTHEEALGTFISGKAAMWLDATALANEVMNPDTSQVYDKVAFAAPPRGPAGNAAALAGWDLALAKKSKNKDAAWAFMMYMTSREKSIDNVKNGGIPTRISIFNNESLQDISYEAQHKSLEYADVLVKKGIIWIPPLPQTSQMLDIVGAYGSAALAGDISVEEASAKAQKDVEDLLNDE